MARIDPDKSRLRRIIESPPWARRVEEPALAVDEETRRLLGNMTAVGLQAVQMLLSVGAAALAGPPAETFFAAVMIGGVLLLRLRRPPFQRFPPPPRERSSDFEYWRSTRWLFRLGQVGFVALGVVIIALVERHAGRGAADLAWRIGLHLGLAGLCAWAYAVQ